MVFLVLNAKTVTLKVLKESLEFLMIEDDHF